MNGWTITKLAFSRILATKARSFLTTLGIVNGAQDLQALADLGAAPVRLLKLALTWPVEPSIVRETPSSALVDGGNTIGYIAAFRGAEIAARKAKDTGLSIVGVYNSFYSGRNAWSSGVMPTSL